jgi:hypothetical protein
MKKLLLIVVLICTAFSVVKGQDALPFISTGISKQALGDFCKARGYTFTGTYEIYNPVVNFDFTTATASYTILPESGSQSYLWLILSVSYQRSTTITGTPTSTIKFDDNGNSGNTFFSPNTIIQQITLCPIVCESYILNKGTATTGVGWVNPIAIKMYIQ